MKYAWIEAARAQHGVRTLCRVLRVSPSGVYAWRARKPSARATSNRKLAEQIADVHRENREAYGSERTWAVLRNRGVSCGRHRVARLRRLHGVVTKRRRRWLSTRSMPVKAAPNRLAWPFASPAANRIWGADITQIPTRQGWLYLAVILDLYSRKIVGWAMSERPQEQLASTALAMALDDRQPGKGLIHHSDQGVQYTSAVYQARLERAGLVCSMSRRAMPFDNAMVESFFSSLKNELTHHEDFQTLDHARGAVFEYVHVFYNRKRLHQSLNYRSPEEFEAGVR